MKTVKIYLPWDDTQFPSLFRQTPTENGIWKNFHFHINDTSTACDYLVVFSGNKSTISERIDKNKTLFIAGEPPDIKKYPERYIAQFGSVICSDTKLLHPEKRLYQQGYPWFCGVQFGEGKNRRSIKNYDDFKKDTQINKTKLISVVCSNKSSKAGHRKRFEFVQKLKDAFGDELDCFGTGQNPISDKTDAIRPYKYHIAIENSVATDYWSEKLSDCYLEEAFPFYAGCPNIDRYYSPKAYLKLNLDSIDESVNTIRKAISENRYETYLAAIQRAKNQVLDVYNIFNLITDHFESLSTQSKTRNLTFKAYPVKYFTKGLAYKIKLMLKDLIT